MESSEFVFSIIIDTIQDYKAFSCESIRALFATNKQCRNNPNIALVYKKYLAQHIFNVFHESIISFVISKHDKIDNKFDYDNFIENLFDNIIFKELPLVATWIKNMIIAEYKEQLYNMIFSRYITITDDIEIQILDKYDNIIFDKKKIEWFDIENHEHNPQDIVYDHGTYIFYERIEKHGFNILDFRKSDMLY